LPAPESRTGRRIKVHYAAVYPWFQHPIMCACPPRPGNVPAQSRPPPPCHPSQARPSLQQALHAPQSSPRTGIACPANQPPYISKLTCQETHWRSVHGHAFSPPPRCSVEAEQRARSSRRGAHSWQGGGPGRGRARPGHPLPPAAAGALGREERHVAREGRVRGRARGAAGRRREHAVHPCTARLRLPRDKRGREHSTCHHPVSNEPLAQA